MQACPMPPSEASPPFYFFNLSLSIFTLVPSLSFSLYPISSQIHARIVKEGKLTTRTTVKPSHGRLWNNTTSQILGLRLLSFYQTKAPNHHHHLHLLHAVKFAFATSLTTRHASTPRVTITFARASKRRRGRRKRWKGVFLNSAQHLRVASATSPIYPSTGLVFALDITLLLALNRL